MVVSQKKIQLFYNYCLFSFLVAKIQFILAFAINSYFRSKFNKMCFTRLAQIVFWKIHIRFGSLFHFSAVQNGKHTQTQFGQTKRKFESINGSDCFGQFTVLRKNSIELSSFFYYLFFIRFLLLLNGVGLLLYPQTLENEHLHVKIKLFACDFNSDTGKQTHCFFLFSLNLKNPSNYFFFSLYFDFVFFLLFFY